MNDLMAGLAGLLKRFTTRLHRGDAAAVESLRAESGQLSDRQRASLDERNNINHTGHSPYGPTNNSGSPL